MTGSLPLVAADAFAARGGRHLESKWCELRGSSRRHAVPRVVQTSLAWARTPQLAPLSGATLVRDLSDPARSTPQPGVPFRARVPHLSQLRLGSPPTPASGETLRPEELPAGAEHADALLRGQDQRPGRDIERPAWPPRNRRTRYQTQQRETTATSGARRRPQHYFPNRTLRVAIGRNPKDRASTAASRRLRLPPAAATYGGRDQAHAAGEP